MYSKLLIIVVVVSALLFSTITQADPVDITKPGDPVKGVPNDSDWPGGEAPPLAIDDNTATKYLHFKGEEGITGFQVTLSAGPSITTGLTFTTANDCAGRDPIAFELYGSNESIDGPYTLIASGDIVDFAQEEEWPRFTKNATPILLDNVVAYNHYQIIFTAIRGPVGGCVDHMQIAEVELLGMTPNPYSPTPTDGVYHEDTWANLVWAPGDTAASHDVYFGDNFDDVNLGAEGTFQGNQAHSSFVVGFPGFLLPDGLASETTYYWRIDEVEANGTTTHKGTVWSFTIPPKIAYEPIPADNAELLDLNVDLGWRPGVGAKLHIVYFGENFDDVNNAEGGIPQSHTTYTFNTLESDKTYYWRVDELDAITTHKGDIWSFKTLHAIPVTDSSLIGWWKFDEGSGTIALDNSGYGNHGTFTGDPQWVTGYDGYALEFDGSGDFLDCGANPSLKISDAVSITAWIKVGNVGIDHKIGGNQDGANGGYKMSMYSNNRVEFEIRTSGNSATLNRDVSGGTEIMEDVWYHVAGVYSQGDGYIRTYVNGNLDRQLATTEELGASPGTFYIGCEPSNTGSANFNGVMDDVRLYNKAITQDEIMEAMWGDPLLAGIPNPANGSTPYIREAIPLSWSPGEKASQHDVYFGIDKDTVAEANASDTTGVYRDRQNATFYTPPEGVEWGGGPYYWRIDEYNNDMTINKGKVWSFTVADFILVDDFELYNNLNPEDPASNRIFNAWLDGFDKPAINGSIVGYATSPFAEQTIVHGGSQSMPFSYDNGVGKSEATLTLTYPRDWTEEGVGVLSLWFRGDTSNVPEPMYVTLNSTMAVNHNNPNAAQIDEWTEWNIDLQAFGVNLANVYTITLGFGNRNNPVAGGSGIVYFDDIRLYRPTP
ncbi:MAG: LamG domain-containing protein [Planctomycetes bacterium]|nr:LamG domain-containing protein [Planctomycetota bacterium]